MWGCFIFYLIKPILFFFTNGHNHVLTVEQWFNGRGEISSFMEGSFMSYLLGSYHYLQKKSPITSHILLLKICSLELNRAMFIYFSWWFVVNDSSKPIRSSIFSFALQKTKPTNRKLLTNSERILYWRHYCACGTVPELHQLWVQQAG